MTFILGLGSYGDNLVMYKLNLNLYSIYCRLQLFFKLAFLYKK